MKTFKFYIGNDVNKEVIVNLTDRELQLYNTVYGFKTDAEIYDNMLFDMEDEFKNLYTTFEDGKRDYEQCIHEIVDAGAAGRATNLLLNGYATYDFIEEVNSLLVANKIMLHYALRAEGLM